MEAAVRDRSVSLSIPAKPDYVVLARLALSAVCRLAPLTAEETADLKLATTEAATYLMGGERRSATRGEAAPETTINFTFELGDDALTIVVAGEELPTVSSEERDLSMALIMATVDDHSVGDGEMRLTKKLERAAG